MATDSPRTRQILTARVGGNADMFPDILSIYVPPGSKVADVTFGLGVFWKQVPPGDYEVAGTDLSTGTDFRHLPYPTASMDCVVLDPPYAFGGATMKPSINGRYRNGRRGYEAVVRLYVAGIIEAARVLRRDGILILKVQDGVENHRNFFVHTRIIEILPDMGFEVEDLFVLVQPTEPTRRHAAQEHARKNHSYFIVASLKTESEGVAA